MTLGIGRWAQQVADGLGWPGQAAEVGRGRAALHLCCAYRTEGLWSCVFRKPEELAAAESLTTDGDKRQA